MGSPTTTGSIPAELASRRRQTDATFLTPDPQRLTHSQAQKTAPVCQSLGPREQTSAYLDHVVVEMLGVAVDQVNLLGVRVVHLLLSHLLCHGLVVGLVDVTLVPDGNSVEMSL